VVLLGPTLGALTIQDIGLLFIIKYATKADAKRQPTSPIATILFLNRSLPDCEDDFVGDFAEIGAPFRNASTSQANNSAVVYRCDRSATIALDTIQSSFPDTSRLSLDGVVDLSVAIVSKSGLAIDISFRLGSFGTFVEMKVLNETRSKAFAFVASRGVELQINS
jgi:hypothetical protein